MHLQFWGAARTVTGSMHLLHVGGRNLLLDCGLYQGRRKIAFEINRNLPFPAASIDAVILSHAHIDHSGNLPTLVKNGFRGPIFATSATRDLCAHMLLDSAHIQESDVRYVNRRRAERNQTPFVPLYTRDDAVAALERFVTVDFHHPFSPLPDVTAHFVFAGHILGAASVVVDAEEGGERRRIVFSGDIGRSDMPIIHDPESVDGADVVIMESTYGGERHQATGEAKNVLRDEVARAVAERGKLIVPAFAVGRTQELVFRLNQLEEEDALPPVDVFVDSPLAIDVTDVLRIHPECYDAEMRDALANDHDGDPLGFKRLQYVRNVEGSKALNTRDGAAVIISASGMCEGGRILHHLRNHIGKRSTTVLFVGYQAEHTLGRRILEGASPVRIFGDEFKVRARVARIEGYSAHADHDELVAWAAEIAARGPARRTFLVHGDLDRQTILAEALRARGLPQVDIPERGQTFPL